MQIVDEDLVDWDPLLMRFIFKKRVSADRRRALAAFIDEWFGAKAKHWLAAREAGAPYEPLCEYLGAHIGGDAAIEASVNRMPPNWLLELTEAVEHSYPDIDHLRLGIPLAGPTVRSEFKWVHVPRGEVTLHGKSVAIDDVDISLHHVSVSQFQEFMRETGYRPIYDRLKRDGSLMSDSRINGYTAKAPVFWVSYDDAVAYCKWTMFRLPSEAELYAFFLGEARNAYPLHWGGQCWTADAEPDGTVVACQGPYTWGLERSPPILENERACYPRDPQRHPKVGFRVAKDD